MRDMNAIGGLRDAGWRVLTVWECSLRGVARLREGEAVSHCAEFLNDTDAYNQNIEGQWEKRGMTH